MPRATIVLNEGDQYISVLAGKIIEDDGYIRATSAQHGLAAVVDMQYVKWAYITEEKGR